MRLLKISSSQFLVFQEALCDSANLPIIDNILIKPYFSPEGIYFSDENMDYFFPYFPAFSL